MPEWELLTEREKEVLLLVGQGRSNRQIANALIIEVATVEQHLSRIFVKLGVTSRIQAALKANVLLYADQEVRAPVRGTAVVDQTTADSPQKDKGKLARQAAKRTVQ